MGKANKDGFKANQRARLKEKVLSLFRKRRTLNPQNTSWFSLGFLLLLVGGSRLVIVVAVFLTLVALGLRPSPALV